MVEEIGEEVTAEKGGKGCSISVVVDRVPRRDD
jgi:hypothetical protein